jgi:ABC-type Mn2+/Zn2+ transport system permease subunit
MRYLRCAGLCALCLLLPRSGSAQPPPPSEGLDPATAPISSTAPAPPTGSAPTPPDAAPIGEGGVSQTVAASPAAVFRLDFMQRALVAGLLVAGVCAYLGVYVVLRRIVFVGVALSEMASAGVALALLVGMPAMLGSVVVMLGGVGLFSVRWGGRRVRQDAFIGIGYVVASALSILMLAKSPQGESQLLDLLFGNILTVTAGEIGAAAAALGAVLAVHTLFAKELLFVSFDPDTAQASGYRARFWETLLYVTIGMTIAFAIHAVGVLLTFAMLLLPAVAALLVTRRMAAAFAVSVVIGLVPVPIGLYLSFIGDLPAAATVVAVLFIVLAVVGAVGARSRR